MSTIYDVAKLSGTSTATVSYVLNGRGKEKHISKETQEKIIAIAERLNYRPNVTARQLKTTKSQGIKIAAFWPDFYFEQSMISIMRAIKNVSSLSTENIEVSIHFFTPDSLNEVWNRFMPFAYNGIVLAGASLKDLDFLAETDHTVPLVLVNRIQENFPYVSVNHDAAGKMACDIIKKCSTDSVIAIWDTRYHVATNLRRTAFETRSRELGFSDAVLSFSCDGSPGDGYSLGISLLQKNLLKKVIYCNNESIARGVAAALNESGIQIGKDLFLFTANNGPDSCCRYISPPLTVINLRMREVFEEAMKVCLALISHAEETNRNVLITPTCIFRESLPESLLENSGISYS